MRRLILTFLSVVAVMLSSCASGILGPFVPSDDDANEIPINPSDTTEKPNIPSSPNDGSDSSSDGSILPPTSHDKLQEDGTIDL